MSQFSNLTFFVKSTLTIASWTGATFNISNDNELDASIELPTETSIVLKNDTQLERMTITATWWVATIVLRGLKQEDSEVEDANLKKQWSDWDAWYVTQLAFDIIDKWEDNTFAWTQTFTDIDFTWITTGGLKVKELTTTQRDAITNVWEWMIIKNSTTWVLNQYIWGAWSDFATWSVVNASEAVAGKWEVSTDAEITTPSSDTWWTGAFLWAKISQLIKLLWFAPTLTSSDEADFFAFSDTDDSTNTKKITKANLRNDLAWSKTLKGTFEMLTDDEVATWIDEGRVPNAKQMKDNYWLAPVWWTTISLAEANTERSKTNDDTYSTVKEIEVDRAWTYSASWETKQSGWATSANNVQVMKNWVSQADWWTSSTSYVSNSTDITVVAWDLLQVRYKTSNDSWPESIFIKDFQVKFDVWSYNLITGTVNND